MLVTAATIASWGKRLDEQGPDALVQFHEPVNKFPDYVRSLVKRLQSLCPTMGKVKICETLARGGLHLAVRTVGRMRKELGEAEEPTPDGPEPEGPTDAAPGQDDSPETAATDKAAKARVVTAKYVNHVWHIDLTTVPTLATDCA